MGQHVVVDNVIPYHLDSLISKLQEIGVNIKCSYDQVEIIKADGPYESTNVKTMPFPGYATDLQAPLTALLTQAKGNSKITETIYIERFKHCHELNKMGANIIWDQLQQLLWGQQN